MGVHPATTIVLALAAMLLPASAARAREAGDPIRLVWDEGDVAGMSTIYAPDGTRVIGSIEYHQHRQGDVLQTTRIAHFADGSSDEDSAEARVAGRLEAIGGRSIIRDTDGEPIVDVDIDVAGGRVTASWGRGNDRQTTDRHVEMPPGTYWGPLIFIVLKNFDANVENDRLVFHTVAPTPRPILLDMALSRAGDAAVDRPGVRLDTVRYDLAPTVHWAIDPVIRLVAPRASFWVLSGEPPALARFVGPRNYARQPIVIQ